MPNLRGYLFVLNKGEKENTIELDGKTHEVGSKGPALLGVNTSFSGKGVRQNATYNQAARALQKILSGDAQCKAAHFNECDYVEYQDNNILYTCAIEFINDVFEVRYQNNNISDAVECRFIPVLFYIFFNQPKQYKQTYTAMMKLIKQYETSGVCKTVDILFFCDTIYCEIPEIRSMRHYLEDLELETISQLKSRELVKEFSFPGVTLPDGCQILKAEEGAKKQREKLDYKNCSMALDFEWNETQTQSIPDVSFLEQFIPVPTFYDLMNKLRFRQNRIIERLQAKASWNQAIGKDYINLSIVGKPATGKTTIAYALGAALRLPVYTICCSKNTEEDEFQGKTKVIKGQLDFVTTDF